MKLKDIKIKELEEKAAEIGTTPGYLKQIKYGYSKPSADLAMKIAKVLGIRLCQVIDPDYDCCPCEEQDADEKEKIVNHRETENGF